MSTAWSPEYAAMVSRHPGFVSAAEQERLRQACIFVCGTGGMGGVAAQQRVRAGVGRLVIADLDQFERSNLNRQVYAEESTLGASKVEITAARLRAINPQLDLTVHGAEWPDRLDEILAGTRVVINAMDDLACGLHLYRSAAAAGVTVIDAYTSPLPNVTVVGPMDPRPERRLGFGTEHADWRSLSNAQKDACRVAEIEYVLTHSSSLAHFDQQVAAEVVSGVRARPSFAPVVWISGSLLAFHAMQVAMGRPMGVDHRGVFYDIWTGRAERPRSPIVAAIRRRFVRAALRSFGSAAG